METILDTPLPSTESYQSPEARAKLAIGGLTACIAMEVLNSLLMTGYTLSGSGFNVEDVGFNVYTTLLVLFALLNGGVYVTTVVLFLMWFHRAYKNLPPLGATALQYSPGWTIGAWFIPFGNLFIPYRIAKEIWVKSGERTEEYAFLNSESTVPATFGTWWGFWIVSNISTNASERLSSTIGDQMGALMIVILANVASILAAIYAIRMIKMITARQDENIAQVTNYGAPPPPPIYDPQAQ